MATKKTPVVPVKVKVDKFPELVVDPGDDEGAQWQLRLACGHVIFKDADYEFVGRKKLIALPPTTVRCGWCEDAAGKPTEAPAPRAAEPATVAPVKVAPRLLATIKGPVAHLSRPGYGTICGGIKPHDTVVHNRNKVTCPACRAQQ